MNVEAKHRENVERRVSDILKETGAQISDHFNLVSGKHSDTYLHVRLIPIFEDYASFIGEEIANRFSDIELDVVMGFTEDGIWLADYIGNFLNIRVVKAEKKKDKVRLIKGYLIEKEEKVLVVDGVLTTGGSISKAIHTVKESGGDVVAVAVVVDRSKKKPQFEVEVRYEWLARVQMNLWNPGPESCRMCRQKVPIKDLSSIETNPQPLWESLPEAIRSVYFYTWRDYLEELKKGKTLTEVINIYRPTNELPGKKHQRVAVLGAFSNWPSIRDVCEVVTRLGYYAVTSKAIFGKDTGKPIEFRHYDYESLNDFLRRMIFCCQYIIILYTAPGGQYIETAWCSSAQKPSLGLVYLEPWADYNLKSCKYLVSDVVHKTLYCDGFKALESGAKLVGGWVCIRNRECPFSAFTLTKMILNLYATSRTMFLVGSCDSKSFEIPISNFLRNRGTLK